MASSWLYFYLVVNVSEKRRFGLLGPEEEGSTRLRNLVNVRHSSHRNTHEALALVTGIATTVTVFLGSLCGGRQVGSEEMDSGLLLETNHAVFLKRICSI